MIRSIASISCENGRNFGVSCAGATIRLAPSPGEGEGGKVVSLLNKWVAVKVLASQLAGGGVFSAYLTLLRGSFQLHA
jgi:hypothetical protein